MIHPDALEAGPYADRMLDQKMGRGENPSGFPRTLLPGRIALPEPDGGQPHPYYRDTGIAHVLDLAWIDVIGDLSLQSYGI